MATNLAATFSVVNPARRLLQNCCTQLDELPQSFLAQSIFLTVIVDRNHEQVIRKAGQFTLERVLTHWLRCIDYPNAADRDDAKTAARVQGWQLLGCEFADRAVGDGRAGGTVARVHVLWVDLDFAVSKHHEEGPEDWARWERGVDLLLTVPMVFTETSGSRPERLRLRGMIPLAKPITGEQAVSVYRRLDALFGGRSGPLQLAYPPIDYPGNRAGTGWHVRVGPSTDFATLDALLPAVPEPEKRAARVRKAKPPKLVVDDDPDAYGWEIVRSYYNVPSIRERACRHCLGDRIVRYPNAVNCIHHDDNNHSAYLAHDPTMLPTLMCVAASHDLPSDMAYELNMGECWHAVSRGFIGPEHAVHRYLPGPTSLAWAQRLLFDCGTLNVGRYANWPEPIDPLVEWVLARGGAIAPPDRRRRDEALEIDDDNLPGGVRRLNMTHARALWHGVRLLGACQHFAFGGHVVPFSTRFVEGWCGLSHSVAANGILFLRRVELLNVVGSVDNARVLYTMEGDAVSLSGKRGDGSARKPTWLYRIARLG